MVSVFELIVEIASTYVTIFYKYASVHFPENSKQC